MSKRTLGLLLLLLFLTRAILVLAVADVFLYGDEPGKGGAAKALLDGTGIERWRLTYVYHEGGGFLVMHLKALAYALLGPSVLANKVTALVTTSLLLAVGYGMVCEHFGRRAGAIFGLLFVLCPDSYLRFSLIAIGTHFEGILPIALVLHFTLRILFDERAPLSDWALLGIFSGLGLYFSLQSAPALAVAAVAVLLRLRRRLFGLELALVLAGFAFGAMPLWAMMGHVGLAALLVQNHPDFGQGPTGLAALRELLYQLVVEPDLWSWVHVIGFAVVIAAGFRLAPGIRGAAARARALPIAAYLGLFLASFLASGFAFPHRGLFTFWLRCSPMWFFATVLFSAAAAMLLEHARPAWRDVALGTVALLAVSGIAAFAGLLAAAPPADLRENWTLLARTRGYDLADYFDKLAHHLEGSIPERFALLLRLEDDPELLLPAASHSLFEGSGVPLPQALELTRAACGDRWLTAVKGLGLVAAPDYGHDLPAAFARIEDQPAKAQTALAEAVGRVALGLMIAPEKIDLQTRSRVPDRLRDPFLRGAGWRVHRMHRLRPDLALDLIGRQPPAAVPAVMAGYRAAREANTLD